MKSTFKIINLNQENISKQIVVNERENIFVYGTKGGDINLEFVLDSENSAFHLYGIFIGKSSHVFNINTVSSHEAKDTISRVHIKTVMFDDAKFNFNGMIRIDKKAQLSDAYLKNDNLIIGNDAIVNSTPQLEISADDVKASHGVTISSIDELETFYIKSRGLTQIQAEELLVYGFINELAGIEGINVDVYSLLAEK